MKKSIKKQKKVKVVEVRRVLAEDENGGSFIEKTFVSEKIGQKKTKIEKLRFGFSWIAMGLFFLVILFSRNPSGGSFFCEFLVLAGYALIIVATLGRLWCTVYIGGRKDSELCRDGPYSITRNPLYVFSFIGLLGILFCAQHLLFVLIITPVFLAYYYVVIRSEEKRLLALFGQEYSDYHSSVTMVIPRFRNYRSQDMIIVNPRMLSRSIFDAGSFLWILLLFEIIKQITVIEINGEKLLPVLWNIPF
ncbi:MAG: isoprenylcysteine carboxylmethyltransferase family protein [Deltaproteobacteria bacterium]|nr:isoprenylcysteine carboxylmethyltransferase family protein [Deltaproteobacteria bacterium]